MMRRVQIELPDDLARCVEFMPEDDLNAMFVEMLRSRLDGGVVASIHATSAFNEDKFFSRLETLLAERTVTGAVSQPKSKEEIKETFKSTVITAKESAPVNIKGDDVIQDFLSNIFK